ncbi:MAG: hypothetical protein JJE27_06160, partial [Thermoleophilia bacterium]|nr:hypothetical protein [Thermoleophilia bacterium]
QVAGGSNGVGGVADVADVGGKTVGDVLPCVSANGRGAHAAVDDDEPRVYNLRIEMNPGMADQLDAAGRVARQAVWVAIAIPAFVFVTNRMRER